MYRLVTSLTLLVALAAVGQSALGTIINTGSLTWINATISDDVVNTGSNAYILARQPNGGFAGFNSLTEVSGSLINENGAELEVFSGKAFDNRPVGQSTSSHLRITNGITNSSLITIDTDNFTNRSSTAILEVSVGSTLVNEAVGTIHFDPHTGGSRSRQLRAEVDNRGLIINNDGATASVFSAGADYLNSGVMNAAGGNFSFSSFNSFTNQATGSLQGRSFTLTGQSAATSTITNDGAVNLPNGGIFPSTFLTFTNNSPITTGGSSTASGFGEFRNNAPLNPGAGSTFRFTSGTYVHNDQNGAALSGDGAYQFDSATVQIQDRLDTNNDITLASAAFSPVGASATFSPNGHTTILAGNSGGAGVLWENQGLMSIATENTGTGVSATVASPMTNDVGGTLFMEAVSTTFGASDSVSLSFTAGMTNRGVINMDAGSIHTNRSATTSLGVSGGPLVNEAGGEIRARLVDGRFVDLSSNNISAELDNRGLVSNEFVRLPTPSFNIGTAGADHLNSGIVRANSATATRFTGDSFTNQPGGIIEGNGFIDFSGLTFVGDGIISPGLSSGILTLEGQIALGSTASLLIEIGGTTVGSQYDRLAINGGTTLDGLLNVSLIDNFLPDFTDTFTILTTTGSRIDFFSNTPSQKVSFPGGSFDVIYHPDSVVLTNFVAPIPEPSSIALAVSGVLSLGLLVWRRRKA